MKKFTFVLILLFIILIFSVSCNNSSEQDNGGIETYSEPEKTPVDANNPLSIAHNLVDSIVAGDFENATEHFDEFLKEEYTPQGLKAMWNETVLKNTGDFKKKIGDRVEEEDNVTIVFINCKFEECFVDARVVFDNDKKKITHISFSPAPHLAVTEDILKKSDDFLKFIVEEDFTSIMEIFTSNMKSEFPEEKMKNYWEEVTKNAGSFQEKIGQTLEQESDGKGITYNIVYLKCEFEKFGIEIKLVFNNENKIAGILFKVKPSYKLVKEFEVMAKEMIENLAAEDFKGAMKNFDDNMKKELSEDVLAKSWEEVIGKMGNYKKSYSLKSDIKNNYVILYMMSQFEKDTIEIQVTFDDEKKIAGLFFYPDGK